MKIILLITLTLFSSHVFAQKQKKIFYDSVGQVTTWENYMSILVLGKYKLVQSGNIRTLQKMTPEEIEAEIKRTEKKISKTDKIGTSFPEFDITDISGNRLVKSELKGRVLVINFWFIGCPPCEMERPALNELRKLYKNNEDVIFISFARNNREQLLEILDDYPILYNVVPTEKDFIKAKFEINAFPINIIVGKDGNYYFNGIASGIGIMTILQRQIDKALKG